jgi:hypothetical protein
MIACSGSEEAANRAGRRDERALRLTGEVPGKASRVGVNRAGNSVSAIPNRSAFEDTEEIRGNARVHAGVGGFASRHLLG